MTSLTTTPLAPLLDRLFQEADAASLLPNPAVDDLSDEELARRMRSKTEYRDFYGQLKDAPLAVSRETGTLLYMLARGGGARSIVEFGTSFGISTLFLAAALRDNGGGRLVTSEFEPSKVARARATLEAGGVAAGLPDSIDLVLLDGAKALYSEILHLVESRLRPGAFIVADDADKSPDYLARVRSPSGGYLSTAFGEDVELSVRLG